VGRRSFTCADVRQFWDGVSDIYEKANDNVREVHDQRYREAHAYFPTEKPSRILNVWSRTGELGDFLKERGIDSFVVNLELSLRMIQTGLALGRQGQYVQSSLDDLPIGSCTMDLVISLETLEHCPDPSRFLREVHRVLRPGGQMILSCPPRYAEIVLWIYERFAVNHGEGPHEFLASRMVKRLLKENGFELLHHRGTLFVPFEQPWAQRVDQWCERILNQCHLSDLGIRQFYNARKISNHEFATR
jgi:SAM-dependent methyltransferase